MRDEVIGFVGAGNMAEAIARGVIEKNLYAAGSLRVTDPSHARREVFESFGVACVPDIASLASACQVIIVAVKPQVLPDILPELSGALTADHLLISICAGVPTTTFGSALAQPVRVVRVMPNTPLQIGLGATALSAGSAATDADLQLAEAVFGAGGETARVTESLLDAVTAVSGSGPAYFYLLTEALIAAGRAQGLDNETARRLAVQTARGAGEMMAAGDLPPEELRARVTSKGGTTEAALKVFDDADFRKLVADAVAAAVQRAGELG